MKLIFLFLVTVLFQLSFEQDITYLSSGNDLSPVVGKATRDKESTPTPDIEETPSPDGEYTPYAYLVHINWKNAHSCAGTLISQNYVLTSAYCVIESRNSPVIVTFGNSDPWNPQSNPISVSSKSIKTFKKWITGERGSWNELFVYKNYDIALIELSQTVKFSNNLKAATLPSWNDERVNLIQQKGESLSWYTSSKEMLVQPLVTQHRVKKCILDRSQNTLCTRDANWSLFHPGCKGTRGGPLIIDGKVYGVAMQFGIECYEGTFKFTQVTSFLGWIADNTDIVIGQYENTFEK